MHQEINENARGLRRKPVQSKCGKVKRERQKEVLSLVLFEDKPPDVNPLLSVY